MLWGSSLPHCSTIFGVGLPLLGNPVARTLRNTTLVIHPSFQKRGSLVIFFCLRGCICFLFPQNCSRLFLVSFVYGETRVSRFERKSSEHATKSPTPSVAGDGETPHVYLRIARRIRMTCAFLRNQTLRWQTWADRKSKLQKHRFLPQDGDFVVTIHMS